MILFSLIIAHLLGDFYFQTNEMAKNKTKNLSLHIAHHFILVIVVLLGFYFMGYLGNHFFFQVVCPSIIIAGLHLVFDKLKILLSRFLAKQPLYELYTFIIDQSLHVLTIVFVCSIFLRIDVFNYLNQFIMIFIKGSNLHLSIPNRILFLIIMLIISTKVTGHVIRLIVGIIPNYLPLYEGKYVLKNIHSDQFQQNKQYLSNISEEFTYMVNKKQDFARGVIIGYLERLLVIVLIVNSSYTSIGFIIAAKSIARFKQMEDRDFAEYFLLGTLSSLFLGIIYGIIIKMVLL